jgi:membrane fusion protein (multidrug efflux system)
MNKRNAATAAILSCVALLCACKKKPVQMPPVDVGVVAVQPQDLSVAVEWVATTDAFINAQVRAQVSGNLISQNYKEGTRVKKGALLFQIDPRPFQTAYDAAKARFNKAASDKERYIPLAASSAISKQELDQAVSAYDQTKADMERARLDLEFTKVVSPIDGVAGQAKAQVGDLVGPAAGVLASVVQLDPIKVYFSISEAQYLGFIKEHESPEARMKAVSGAVFELVLADGTTYAKKGTFYSKDNAVDPNTGTLRLTLAFPNPGDTLQPGQFGRVRHLDAMKGVLAVPQGAVMEAQGSRQVAVVDETNTVRLRTVQTGDDAGTMTIITGGLKPGERVVAEGLLKVQDGAVVNPAPFSMSASTEPAVVRPSKRGSKGS